MDKRTKPDQEDTQITQEGSKEDQTTLVMKDECNKEIKRNEEITQNNIRMTYRCFVIWCCFEKLAPKTSLYSVKKCQWINIYVYIWIFHPNSQYDFAL
jgi:hypothetical protein